MLRIPKHSNHSPHPTPNQKTRSGVAVFRIVALRIGAWLWLMASCQVACSQFHIDIDQAPFNYTETQAVNRVTLLVSAMESKQIELEHNWQNGYLESLLKALEIDSTSQVLVFSKTSLQVRYITRNNPRAIYFNDDTYVGWVNGSSLMEISTFDPKLGAAFYLVEMSPRKPQIKRSGYECLGCHSTSMTQGVPGHVVRSVFASFDGTIRPQMESFITDHSSPFSKRWGGWYVTGKHGDMNHMGNAYYRNEQLDTHTNGNLDRLDREFNTNNYLTPYSDIVALMVLEHQSQMHNTLTRADFAMRQLKHERSKSENTLQAAELPSQQNAHLPSQQAGEQSDAQWDLQLRDLAKPIVDRLLFVNEFNLTSPVSGREEYAKQFVGRGPKDTRGRSLREFDLTRRLFKYPCSYLIYSDAFDALDDELRSEVCRQLYRVLRGQERSDTYAHLDAETRSTILEILNETKPGLELRVNSADRSTN